MAEVERSFKKKINSIDIMQKQLNTSKPNIVPSKPNIRNSAIDKAYAFLKIWEGEKLKAYKCPAGVWTIGIGNITINGVPVKEGMTITKEQSKQYCLEFINTMLNGKNGLWVDVHHCNSNQIAAIISFVYNVGIGAWQRSSLRQVVLKDPNNRQAITIAFQKWNTANGKILQGLVNRREAEIQLYFSKS
jgi:lysozyme